MAFDIYIITIGIGFFLFLITLFFYLQSRTLTQTLRENFSQSRLELDTKTKENETLQKERSSLELRYAILNTRYEEEIHAWKEKLAVLKNAKDELSKEFKLLANKIFEDKSTQFATANKEQLEFLLKPFREQITSFSKEAKEQFHATTKDTHLLKNELSHLKEMNSQLSQDAINLTKALKGENKTQGNWGEIVLENILEQSGLRKSVEYELQVTLKSEEGKTYRPDVIIHMPQERDIIVDSKVSLVAYERFMSAEDDLEKRVALKDHITSIKEHIKGLSEKKYEKLEGVYTLDFVLLFMPIEGAFLLALEQDGEFFKHAYEKNILVVSPSTLLVTLRIIEHIWRTQRQEEHAQKIAHEAEAMYDKLVGFVEEMQNIGRTLEKTQESYDKAMGRLHTGRGNIIKRAENIRELGVKPTKELSIVSESES